MLDSLRRVVWELWRRAGALARTPINSVRNNPGLGLLALGLSASLWVLITIERNPLKTDTFGRPIPVRVVNLADDLAVLGEIEPVEVRITAPLDSWNRLGEDSFKAIVDLSGQRAGEWEVPVRVTSTDRQVRILGVIPTEVSVHIEALREQVVPVKVNLQNAPAFGYTFESPQPAVEQVTVFGPERLVNQVDHAVANVDLEGAKVSIKQSFPLSPRTGRDYEVEGVTLDPSSVLVEVPIKQQLLYQSFAVTPELEGEVASGYWVSGISIQPANVTIVGPREVLRDISYLHTEPIDISGATNDVIRLGRIDLPEGASLLGAERVFIQVSIDPAIGTQVLWVAPQLKGVSSGTTALFDVAMVEIIVSGELPVLRDLLPTEIDVTLDVTNLGLGFYFVEPEVEIAKKGVEVIDLKPSTIGVTIE